MTKAIENFSQSFYPFLHEENKKPEELIDELRFSLLEKARESVEVKLRFFEENQDEILRAALVLAETFYRGNKMLICGNGGSATDAQHIAVEFMHPITVGRKALPAICLNNDMAMITAVANDVSFADVFVRQIIALGKKGDALIAISTSGNSENLLHAFETARKMEIATIGFAGSDGGRTQALKEQGLIDFCFTVPTSSIHRIQESHVALYHIIWDLVHEYFQHKSLLSEPSAVADG
jgi:D-sedoheptulose 7-phosphate isomerase